jgi:hypothetical protein
LTLQALQIFGTKKCSDTRKAERFFRERGVPFQAVDLARKGLSPGELSAVAARAGGMEALIDREGDQDFVKVCDFGLAKALEPASAASANVTASPTITSPAAMTGVGAAVEPQHRGLLHGI